MAVWTAAQTAQFLRQVRGHRLYALFHLTALRGLRRAEAAGLTWGDLDLDAGTLTVTRQLQQLGGRLAAAPPKSDAGRRVIALDKTTIAALREHRARQQTERASAGTRWTQTGYVFTTKMGRPFGPDRMTRLFAKLVVASGLPPVTLHGLPHGAATLALAAGTDLKIVQDQLGHSTIVLTADTYTSVLPETARTAAEHTAALLFPAPRPPRQERKARGVAGTQAAAPGMGKAGSPKTAPRSLTSASYCGDRYRRYPLAAGSGPTRPEHLSDNRIVARCRTGSEVFPGWLFPGARFRLTLAVPHTTWARGDSQMARRPPGRRPALVRHRPGPQDRLYQLADSVHRQRPRPVPAEDRCKQARPGPGRHHGAGAAPIPGRTGTLVPGARPDPMRVRVHRARRRADVPGLPHPDLHPASEGIGPAPVRLHDLRHGAASLALAAGVDLKVVADQLGHCSIVLTADTYVSVAVELALSAAEAVARLVLRAGKRPPGGGKIRKPSTRPRAVVAAA